MDLNIPQSFFQVEGIPLYCDFAKQGTVVVVDTETTGLTDADDVVQLAVEVLKNGNVDFRKAVYLKNQVPIDGTEAQKVNWITDAMLAEKGFAPIDVLEDFLALLETTIAAEGKVLLVAHNLSFDWRMIANMLSRYGCSPIPKEVIPCCTKNFVKSLQLPKDVLPSNRLCDCIKSFNLQAQNSHDALDDADACMFLFRFLTS